MNHCRPTTRRLPDGLAPSAGAEREEDHDQERPVSYVLGIDVGAERVSAAIGRPGFDDVEPVDLGDGGCGVASVLHLGADGSLDVGAAAERWADEEPERVVRGFPGRIGDGEPMRLADEPWAPEELTAWLVRWVVDRVAEREGAATGVAVARPAGWDDARTALLAGALAEQDLDVAFLTSTQAAAWSPARPDSSEQVASDAACGAALALLAGEVEEQQADVAGQLAALANFPSLPQDSPDVPAPRSHSSGGWSGPERRTEGSGAHAAGASLFEPSGAHSVAPVADSPGEPADHGSGAHTAVERPSTDDGSGSHRVTAPPGEVDPAAATDNDGLFTALGGFTGTFGATNTAGLLSGYTPPGGLALSATGSQATALVVDEQLALPLQRNGSGRWAAANGLEQAEEYGAAAAAPAAARGRSPAALVSIGGVAAAVAVVSTLFLWPAPRTTNSATSRPIPLVPAVSAPAEPIVELTPTPTLAPTTSHRPRPVVTRTRRAAAPPPSVPETTAPSESVDPSASASTSVPPSESTPPTSTTEKKDED